MASDPDRPLLFRLALREAAAEARAVLVRAVRLLVGWRMQPRSLLLAPHDLRTSDPTAADDIYSGRFILAGRVAETSGRPPFAIEPPSRAWAEALYGFGWLRHLRVADTPLARANARALVDEFITGPIADPAAARRMEVVARRLISLLSQSPLLIEGADYPFYRRLLHLIGANIRRLETELRALPLAPGRLSALIALTYAGLCCEGCEDLLARVAPRLERELDLQIFADGGHVSRNPRVIVELLLDLLPLIQLFASRGLEPPQALLGATDRIMPMLRLLRHGDGTLARFNGAGVTAVDHLATVLFYDDAFSKPLSHAAQSGYDRLQARDTAVIADFGEAPPVPFSAEAHAGCLSFELSSGPYPIVVNCGASRSGRAEVVRAARSTAAHATATIADSSSAQFLDSGDRAGILRRWLLRRLGPVILRGPTVHGRRRREDAEGLHLRASHDGYARRFGISHGRRLRLAAAGDRLDGEDSFARAAEAALPDEVSLRFHLHPSVEARHVQNGRVILLMLPNREAWQFEAEPVEARLDDSIFFAAVDGARRAQQIVLTLRASETTAVRWRFERLTVGRDRAEAETATAEPSGALP